MPWEAIKYVTSGFTLVAFLALAALFVYQHYVRTPERLIGLVNPEERYDLVKSQLAARAGKEKFRMASSVLGAIFFISLIGAVASFNATPSPTTDPGSATDRTDPVPPPHPAATGSTGPAPVVKSVPVHDVQVSVYSGARQPRFLIDQKPTAPREYTSGIASFRLSAGHHEISADYPDRTCTANFVVPATSLVAADCSLK